MANSPPIKNWPPNLDDLLSIYSYQVSEQNKDLNNQHYQQALDRLDVLTNNKITSYYNDPTTTDTSRRFLERALSKLVIYYININHQNAKGSLSAQQGAVGITQTFADYDYVPPDVLNLLTLSGIYDQNRTINLSNNFQSYKPNIVDTIYGNDYMSKNNLFLNFLTEGGIKAGQNINVIYNGLGNEGKPQYTINAITPPSNNLWVENAGQLQPKTSQLISVLGQKIASLADGVNDNDAVNFKQLKQTNNNVTQNTKTGLLNSKNITNNTNTINQEKQTIQSVQATANNADALSKSNKTKVDKNETNINTNIIDIGDIKNNGFYLDFGKGRVQVAAFNASGIITSNYNPANKLWSLDGERKVHNLYIFKHDPNRNYILDVQNNIITKLDFKNKNYEIKIIYKFDWGGGKIISGIISFYFGKDYLSFFTGTDFKVTSQSVQDYTLHPASPMISSIFGMTENNGFVSCTFYFRDNTTMYLYDKRWNNRFKIFAVKYEEV